MRSRTADGTPLPRGTAPVHNEGEVIGWTGLAPVTRAAHEAEMTALAARGARLARCRECDHTLLALLDYGDQWHVVARHGRQYARTLDLLCDRFGGDVRGGECDSCGRDVRVNLRRLAEREPGCAVLC